MAFFANGAQEIHEERSGGRVHGGFLACLRRVTNSSKFRFLYSLFEEDLGSEVVFWFVAHVHVHPHLPIPLRMLC